MSKQVFIADTNVANIASVIAAFKKVGGASKLSSNKEEIESAEYVILPGVGSFGAGMGKLKSTEIDQAIISRTKKDLPTLVICLGMHLISHSSEESPGVEGLSIIDSHATKFKNAKTIPQMGWNFVTLKDSNYRVLEEGYYYFANSYCLKEVPNNCKVGTTSYGEEFVSAFEMGNLIACQFHPELSGNSGLEILNKWINL